METVVGTALLRLMLKQKCQYFVMCPSQYTGLVPETTVGSYQLRKQEAISSEQ